MVQDAFRLRKQQLAGLVPGTPLYKDDAEGVGSAAQVHPREVSYPLHGHSQRRSLSALPEIIQEA